MFKTDIPTRAPIHGSDDLATQEWVEWFTENAEIYPPVSNTFHEDGGLSVVWGIWFDFHANQSQAPLSEPLMVAGSLSHMWVLWFQQNTVV